MRARPGAQPPGPGPCVILARGCRSRGTATCEKIEPQPTRSPCAHLHGEHAGPEAGRTARKVLVVVVLSAVGLAACSNGSPIAGPGHLCRERPPVASATPASSATPAAVGHAGREATPGAASPRRSPAPPPATSTPVRSSRRRRSPRSSATERCRQSRCRRRMGRRAVCLERPDLRLLRQRRDGGQHRGGRRPGGAGREGEARRSSRGRGHRRRTSPGSETAPW